MTNDDDQREDEIKNKLERELEKSHRCQLCGKEISKSQYLNYSYCDKCLDTYDIKVD